MAMGGSDERGAALPSLPYATPATPKEPNQRLIKILLIVAVAIIAMAVAGIATLGVYIYDVASWVDVEFTVENDSATTIPLVQFSFCGEAFTLKNIGPGTTIQKHAMPCGNGPMTYKVKLQNSSTLSGAADNNLHLDEDCRGTPVRIRFRNGVVSDF